MDIGYPRIEDQPLLKVNMMNSSDKIPDHLPCDPWHVGGNSNIHSHSLSRNFIEMCKHKLIRRKLNFYVGSTGYIEWNEIIPTGMYCWDIDELGRFVGIVDNIWFFQRYTNGDILVWTPINRDDWSSMDSEKIKSISNIIEEWDDHRTIH